MAISGRVFITLLFACAILHGAAAITYNVGGSEGWVQRSKDFTVYDDQFKNVILTANDSLIFSPLNSTIDVIMIPEENVATCNNSIVLNGKLAFSGNATFEAKYTLGVPGTYGFICDISDSCTNRGMHFKVTVAGPAPPPAPIAPSVDNPKPAKASVLESGSTMLMAAVLAGGAVLLL